MKPKKSPWTPSSIQEKRTVHLSFIQHSPTPWDQFDISKCDRMAVNRARTEQSFQISSFDKKRFVNSYISNVKQCQVLTLYQLHELNMNLTLAEFSYLAICVEGLFFGDISVFWLVWHLLKQLQDYILAYLRCIYYIMDPEKTMVVTWKRKISSSMRPVFYMFYPRLPLRLI